MYKIYYVPLGHSCCVKYKVETKANLYPVFFFGRKNFNQLQKWRTPYKSKETDNVLCSVFTKYMYQAQSVFFLMWRGIFKTDKLKNQISKNLDLEERHITLKLLFCKVNFVYFPFNFLYEWGILLQNSNFLYVILRKMSIARKKVERLWGMLRSCVYILYITT